MGRVLLLIVAALVGAAGCSGEGSSVAGETAHADLACAACHRGGLSGLELAAVPGSACAAPGCHTDAGPAQVTLASVTFEHRGHGDGDAVAMSCSGCHAHDAGSEPLSGGTDACGLCHADGLTGESPAECLACHRVPDHLGVTSQGVEIPHEGMSWVQGECVRCHYDVSEPATGVAPATCSGCHDEGETLTARSVGRDLHPDHTEVSCGACHAAGGHRIVAMSSAVELECAQCHLRSHDLELAAGFPGAATCAACHRDVHTAQQRLLLGVFPGRAGTAPSEKFMDGLTCRSCHAAERPDGAGGTVVAGSGVSCSGCHRKEYATVLRWWTEGAGQRLRLVEDYLTRVEPLVGPDAPGAARGLLSDAGGLVDRVRAGGAPHNLPLAHRLLAEALESAEAAARTAGRIPPSPPDLGREPRMGVCSYCHYRTDDRMRFAEMDEAFHREALGVGGARR